MSQKGKKEVVVLIHGLFFHSPAMLPLAWRLRRCGYRVKLVDYRTRGSLDDAARRLQRTVQRIDDPVVHFVGHSMGGLVIRELFHAYPQQRPGCVVTLGTPHAGSGVSRLLARNGFWRRLFGEALPWLAGKVPPWLGQRSLGSLAGDHDVGIGRLFGALSGPNDGTVTVVETVLVGMSDHRLVHTSHSGMLLSPPVARQVCHFLKHGFFDSRTQV